LKQLVNNQTRKDHRAIMDGMIQLYAQYLETVEKRSMGFRMSAWDDKLIKYGELFESRMMSLDVNIPLEEALDRGWSILAECFKPEETGFRSELVKEFWPKKEEAEGAENGED
jgi:V/A-type H+-transporting ATPase subunit B